MIFFQSPVAPHFRGVNIFSIFSIFSPYYQKDKKIIEKIQRRFTLLIPGLSELSYEDRLKSLHLWSLEDRRLRADLIEVYRMYHGLSAVDFETFFELDIDSRTRGHTLKLKKGRVATDLRHHFFTERIVNTWKLEPS